jgi:AcrR family transcriptional regulator
MMAEADVRACGAEKTERGKARDLILEAAERVFGEEGIKGATTREIARVAGVNETTLFRNFASKELLLKAVVEKNMAEALERLYAPEHWTNDLEKDLLRYAKAYMQHLQGHEAILRVYISELKRLPDEARQMFNVTNAPVRDKLIEYFEAAKKRGQIRPEVDSLRTVHAFLSTMLMAVLRNGLIELPYTSDEYIQTVLDVFVRGIRLD